MTDVFETSQILHQRIYKFGEVGGLAAYGVVYGTSYDLRIQHIYQSHHGGAKNRQHKKKLTAFQELKKKLRL